MNNHIFSGFNFFLVSLCFCLSACASKPVKTTFLESSVSASFEVRHDTGVWQVSEAEPIPTAYLNRESGTAELKFELVSLDDWAGSIVISDSLDMTKDGIAVFPSSEVYLSANQILPISVDINTDVISSTAGVLQIKGGNNILYKYRLVFQNPSIEQILERENLLAEFQFQDENTQVYLKYPAFLQVYEKKYIQDNIPAYIKKQRKTHGLFLGSFGGFISVGIFKHKYEVVSDIDILIDEIMGDYNSMGGGLYDLQILTKKKDSATFEYKFVATPSDSQYKAGAALENCEECGGADSRAPYIIKVKILTIPDSENEFSNVYMVNISVLQNKYAEYKDLIDMMTSSFQFVD